jgi:cell division protein FtsB
MLDSPGREQGRFLLALRKLLAFFSPGRIVLAASLIVIVYLLFSAGGSALDYYRFAGDEDRLRDQVTRLQNEEQQLEQIRDYLRSDDYVEFMARRVFGLVKPGETLVIVQSPDSDEDAVEQTAGESWWQRLFGR